MIFAGIPKRFQHDRPDMPHRTAHTRLLLNELSQTIQFTTSLIIFRFVRNPSREPFQRGKALNVEFPTEISVSVRIHFGNDHFVFNMRKSISQFFVDRSQAFAVTAPGRIKFHQGRRAAINDLQEGCESERDAQVKMKRKPRLYQSFPASNRRRCSQKPTAETAAATTTTNFEFPSFAFWGLFRFHRVPMHVLFMTSVLHQ